MTTMILTEYEKRNGLEPVYEGKRWWHKGPPPHVGWWNASASRGATAWRWWDGTCWSVVVFSEERPEHAGRRALLPKNSTNVEWTDYWPKGARVPRINPNEVQS